MGKQTRRATKDVRYRVNPIPPSIISRYQNVTLIGDIMKINRLPFFTTISPSVMFRSGEYTKQTKTVNLVNTINHVQRIYSLQGLKV